MLTWISESINSHFSFKNVWMNEFTVLANILLPDENKTWVHVPRLLVLPVGRIISSILQWKVLMAQPPFCVSGQDFHGGNENRKKRYYDPAKHFAFVLFHLIFIETCGWVFWFSQRRPQSHWDYTVGLGFEFGSLILDNQHVSTQCQWFTWSCEM